jgi:hypothetical protein
MQPRKSRRKTGIDARAGWQMIRQNAQAHWRIRLQAGRPLVQAMRRMF